MVNDPTELMLADLTAKYAELPISDAIMRLYSEDVRFGRIFANLHERLNGHFESINGRAESTHHYWAEPSRELLTLNKEIDETLASLKEAGIEVLFSKEYRESLNRCLLWLSQYGGSTVPDDFAQIQLIKWEPAFTRPETSVQLKKNLTKVTRQLIGEGSYAKVYSYVDPDYGIKFAIKQANKNLNERDLHRFRQEFDVLKDLSFPYVVEVYQFDEARNEYKMEFCDATLRGYIAKNNNKLTFASRKRIALQFLYGVNYIHSRSLLHRDISLQNVLLKIYHSGAVLVKLSDFGLVKDQFSTYTRTKTEMRGSIRDPQLETFKDYNKLNEMYSIGWVLSYIFTGRDALKSGSDEVSHIIEKCTASNLAERYHSVLDLIAAVESLAASPSEASE